MDEIKVTVVKYPARKNLMLRYIDPMTGKQKHKSAETADRKAAQKAAGKWEDDLREGRYAAPCRITWEDFRERYEKEALPRLARRTAEMRANVFNHVTAILSPRRVSDLTPERLSHYQAELRKVDAKEVESARLALSAAKEALTAAQAAKPKPARKGAAGRANPVKRAAERVARCEAALKRVSKPRTDATIKGNLAHLRSVLAWAVSVGMLRAIPKMQMPTRNLGGMMRGRPVTGEEFDRMLAKAVDVRPADHLRWERYLHGLWLSGLRLDESLRLTWDGDGAFCVDLSGKFPQFRIYAEGQKSHKNEKLPMTPDFATWLLETPQEQRTGLVFDLGSNPGRQAGTQQAGRIVSQIGKRAGVIVNRDQGKFASAHDLRRSFGTRWASKVMPAVLQKLMRHSTIDTTLRYYVDQDADDVAAELWAGFGNTSGNSGYISNENHRAHV